MARIYKLRTDGMEVFYRVLSLEPLTVEYGVPSFVKAFGHTFGSTSDFASRGQLVSLHIQKDAAGVYHPWPPDASLQDVGEGSLLSWVTDSKLLGRLKKIKVKFQTIDGISPDAIIAALVSHHQDLLAQAYKLQERQMSPPTEPSQKQPTVQSALAIPIALNELWSVDTQDQTAKPLLMSSGVNRALFGEMIQDLQQKMLPWGKQTAEVHLNSDRGKSAKLRMAAGVHVVLGPASSGKTALTRAIEASQPRVSERLVYLEPPEISTLRSNQIVLASEADLARALAMALVRRSTQLILVDSYRAFFYAPSTGGTGAGGVNMGLFANMTMLDIVARAIGKIVIVVVNPLTNDADKLSFYAEAVEGSVEGVIIPLGVDPTTKALRFTTKSRTIGGRVDRTTTIHLTADRRPMDRVDELPRDSDFSIFQ